MDNIEINEEMKIDFILEKKNINGIIYCKVKWVGLPIEKSTWEPLESLTQYKEEIENKEDSNYDNFYNSDISEENIDRHCFTIDLQNDYMRMNDSDSDELIDKNENKFGNKILVLLDVPIRILGLRNTKKGIEASIEWRSHSDNKKFFQSWYHIKKLRGNQTLAKMLVDYYESRISS